MDGFIRVAAATPKIRVADCEYNAAAAVAMMREAEACHCAVLVLPELTLSAYTCADLFLQDALLRGAASALRQVLAESRNSQLLVVLGLPYQVNSRLYNVAAVIQAGRLLGMVPKTYLPNYSEFYEKRWFSSYSGEPQLLSFVDESGESQTFYFGTKLLFEAEDMTELSIGVELCEDVWAPQTPSTAHALAGASLIVNCSASDETVGKAAYRRSLIAATSARLVCAYVYANAGEGESSQDLVFGGHNLICENGQLLAESERYRSGLQYADIDLYRLRSDRRRLAYFGAEREGYRCIPFKPPGFLEAAHFERRLSPQPFVPAERLEREARCEEILAIQAQGLKKRLEHTGSQVLVLGLSGGLDSTLALLVAVRAFDSLGLERAGICCVTMPCFGTTDRTYNNACQLSRALNTTLREINIKAAVLQHFSDIGHEPDDHSVTYENSQARERTQVLMDVANQLGGLVLGTGDMSELALGWATYNGDHMSMYGVNAGVPKTLVRYLVQYEAERAQTEALRTCLFDILATPVSPELLPPSADGQIAQRTEELVGPYELHDFFLYYVLRYGSSPRRIWELACQVFLAQEGREVYSRELLLYWLRNFYRRFFAQQFKRSCLPDGPKVGSVALSPRGDWRMPSDAVVNLWKKELESLG